MSRVSSRRPRILPSAAVALLLALGMSAVIALFDWMTLAGHSLADSSPAGLELRRIAFVAGVTLVVFWLLRRRERRAAHEHRAADERLRALEERHRAIIDLAGLGISEVDLDGRFLRVNPALCRITGYPEAELLTMSGRDLTPPEEWPASVARMQAAIHGASDSFSMEKRYRRRDGGTVWVELTSVLARDVRGEPAFFVTVTQDIGARREALAALAASESRYRSLIETMDEAVLVFDAEGRNVGSNPAAARVFGTDEAGIRSAGPVRPTLRLFDQDGHELAPEERPSFRAIHRRERVSGAILRALRPDGIEVMLEINARPLASDTGLPGGAVVVLADVSAREAARRDVRMLADSLERRVAERTAELSQLNRELESFAYSVSHDLRAPLRAIAGFASLLAEEERARLSPGGLELLERVGGNAERMGELIDDVLEYSRATRSERHHEDIDLDLLVAEASAAARAAHPATRWDALPLGHAQADPAMLRQVFENLIGNAFKYSARADSPAVRVERLIDQGHVWYEVSDNGIGFDMRFADRLFGLFQRMHADPAYPGTGVGLAIVKRLIERHGGVVDAWAEPGRGARFRFHLGERVEPTTP